MTLVRPHRHLRHGHGRQRLAQLKCDALFVLADPTQPKIISLAAKAKMPALYQFSNFVDLGGLASYGASIPPLYRKAAIYVDKIFKGADPAGFPVEQPIVFEFAPKFKNCGGARP
jgi:putative ABC transport system substrate-binding protein